jgi:hypothetical protein
MAIFLKTALTILINFKQFISLSKAAEIIFSGK